ncbi:ABC-3 protein [Paenibacillus vortex V453]|jgi:zinc transport system permease protein|uniref:ABC-3 protein n=1 Tax=Paenibacillus vortex V453 TaxID=715225 RepID=A0A2R9STC4_9BACL|nr:MULTISPECIES: metal ABC transporter permease [Paenibacillus]MCA4750961.1 metal ABC transporter permease [Mycolicibacterium fortuitum]AVV58455.1 metal ABC transporter permease [Paenibacillus glucanolyticus]AWP27620.1 zinc ABC transporter permease [Paenibacillus sp. Cedars]EFU40614.1 ABC-3 protein [Paenibacillus vortex V453]ETT40054.1 ABC-3 protein [Paenibacillus sp. FSL R5-808]
MAMLSYEFMQRAFWAGGLIGIIGPVLGVFLMLRRQVLMADTLSHVSLAGVALGSFLKLNPALSGFAIAIMGALVIEQLRRVYRTYSEVPVAIIMTSGLALAVVLMSLNQNLSKSFSSYLFGSIVAVSDMQLRLIAVVAAVGVLFFVGLRRPLYTFAFDEETAAVSGTRVSLLSFLFAVFTGMTVAAAMPVVGVLLVSALIVLPASIALRIAPGFIAAMGIAVAVGLSGVFSGLTASYYLNTPPGGTIALILLGFLMIAVIFQKLMQIQNRRRIQKINRNRSYKNYEEI